MSETTRRGQNAGASGIDPLVDAQGGDPAPKRSDRGGPDEQVGQDRAFGNEGASESVAQVKQERDELKEQVLRARAEFANYQKRAKQQADSDRVYAVGSLARDLLDPLDNLERAIEALRASAAVGVTAGLDMVQRQLMEILAKHGVEPIPALEQPFDPNLHDAVMQQPSREHPEGTVVSELSKGYTIRDRVLRPSKVAVSAKPGPE
jgi:molecular chaperone GrpE